MEQVSKSGALEETKSSQSRNFGLNKAGFDQLLLQLKNGNESLFQTIFLDHFEDCMQYLKSTYRMSHIAAYDASMDALLLFRKKLLEGKIQHGNMRFLFTRMAYQLHLKALQKQDQIQQIPVQEWWPDDEDEFDEEAMQALEKAWNKLCHDCSNILKQFYFYKTTLQDLSTQMNINAASLRKRKQRCVEKLRSHFAKFYNI